LVRFGAALAMTMDEGENFYTGLCFDPIGGGGIAAAAAAAAAEALQAGLGVPRSPGALNTPVSVSSDANFSFKTDFLVSVEPVPITGTLHDQCRFHHTIMLLCSECRIARLINSR